MSAPAPPPDPQALHAAPDRAPPLVALQGARLVLGRRVVLDGVQVAVHRGDRIAVVGPNGAGKTSLLRLLNGLVPLDAGQRHSSPHRASMLAQRPFLLNLSAEANVALAAWLAGVQRGERRQRVAEALARARLSEQARRPARTLSGGQQQRLALARAWVQAPDLLYLDEPTASLDPQAKRSVEALLQELAEGGMTWVFSTHNLGQAKRLATRVWCVDGGELVADCPVDAFFNGPLPERAAAFLRGEGLGRG